MSLGTLCTALVLTFVGVSGTPAAESSGDPVAGARLAAELRTMHPGSDTNWTGVLVQRLSRQDTVEIPLACDIVVEANRWLSVYNSWNITNRPAEKLVVVRHFDGRTEYLYWQSPGGVELPDEPMRLRGAEANRPFAGSDFLLSDLGLEFLQWPTQLQQPGEMRRGQPCYVLDSINPNPTNGYARVRSWIEKQQLGLLMAEAYDDNGKMIKEFNAGTLARDAAGNYQLKDMEIRSVREKTKTELQFDVKR